jgi:glutamate/aspartate transport system substrate-binding protein
MKKQILALAAVALVSGIAVAQTAAPAAAPAAPAAPVQATLDKVKASGVVTMGVREASGALSYTLGDGKFAGFHVEVCQRIAAEMEKAVGRKLEVKYQVVTSQNRIPLLQNGTVDMECGSTTNNATRAKDVSFLNTVFMEQVRIAVKGKSGIDSIAKLNGKNVATTTGTTSIQLLRRHERATGMDFKEVFGKDHADSFLLLETDRAEAFVMDASILIGNIVNSKSPADYRIVGEPLSLEPIGIMVRKDDAGMIKLGNDVIAAMVRSGDMAKAYDKWFTQPIPPKNVNVNLPATVETKAAWASLNNKPAEDFVKK